MISLFLLEYDLLVFFYNTAQKLFGILEQRKTHKAHLSAVKFVSLQHQHL